MYFMVTLDKFLNLPETQLSRVKKRGKDKA